MSQHHPKQSSSSIGPLWPLNYDTPSPVVIKRFTCPHLSCSCSLQPSYSGHLTFERATVNERAKWCKKVPLTKPPRSAVAAEGARGETPTLGHAPERDRARCLTCSASSHAAASPQAVSLHLPSGQFGSYASALPGQFCFCGFLSFLPLPVQIADPVLPGSPSSPVDTP